MGEQYRIRPFKPGDRDRLHEIREAAFRPVFRSFREIVGKKIASIAMVNAEKEQAELLDKICKDDSSYDLLVIEHSGEVVGFCGLKLDNKTEVGEIELVAVHPDQQGKGLGTALNEAALDFMRKAGMRVVTVGTGGDPSHAAARRSYEKAGFGPTIPSVWMFRTL